MVASKSNKYSYVVGAKKLTQKELATIPSTPQADLRRYFKRNPEAVLANPNCPADLLMENAVDHHIVVEKNPALSLLQLEDPATFVEMKKKLDARWIVDGVKVKVWEEFIFKVVKPLCEFFLAPTGIDVDKLCNALAETDFHGDESHFITMVLVAIDKDLPKKYSDRTPHQKGISGVRHLINELNWVRCNSREIGRVILENTAELITDMRVLQGKESDDKFVIQNHVRERFERLRTWLADQMREHYATHMSTSSRNKLLFSNWDGVDIVGRKKNSRRGMHRVGALPFLDDLSITADEIERRSQVLGKDRIEPALAIQHPNISPDYFATLAEDHPLEAMRNPTLALWILEDPNFWNDIEYGRLDRWLELMIPTLSHDRQALFTLECLDRVLPIWKKYCPKDKRPIVAFNQMVKLSKGESSYEDSINPIEASRYAARLMYEGKRAASLVARAVAESLRSPVNSVAIASEARAAEADPYDFSDKFWDAKFKEQKWQWNHLLKKYLHITTPMIGVK